MLKKVLFIVALAIMLVSAFTTAGCSSGNALTDMLDRVPGDAISFKFVDVNALRNDSDLSEPYDRWKTAVDSRLEAHGINSGDVNLFGFGAASDKRFTLLEGGFELDALREKLDSLGYDEGEYKGVEVWRIEAPAVLNPDPRVAILDKLVILGNEAGVEACIKVIKEGDTSIMKKVDIKDVVDRLPSGIYVDLEKATLVGLIVPGFESYGISVDKEDSDTLAVAGVAKFGDEDEAADGRDAIETMLETIYESTNLEQDKEFLVASAELDVDKTGFLFNGM